MRPRRLVPLILLFAASFAGAADVPIVVELFTSQGCSSCPPADALLRELDGQAIDGARVIVLSQHVDYWNGLGWEDPFSARAFTTRQYRYGERLAAGRVYTPQIVINGEVEFVGNRRKEAYDVIAAAVKHPGTPIRVELETMRSKTGKLSLTVVLPDLADVTTPVEVMLALTESGLASNVERGENAGRQLSHAGVVRRLESLGMARPADGKYERKRRLALDPGWNRPHLRAVVFLQQQGQGRIVGAATTGLAANP